MGKVSTMMMNPASLVYTEAEGKSEWRGVGVDNNRVGMICNSLAVGISRVVVEKMIAVVVE